MDQQNHRCEYCGVTFAVGQQAHAHLAECPSCHEICDVPAREEPRAAKADVIELTRAETAPRPPRRKIARAVIALALGLFTLSFYTSDLRNFVGDFIYENVGLLLWEGQDRPGRNEIRNETERWELSPMNPARQMAVRLSLATQLTGLALCCAGLVLCTRRQGVHALSAGMVFAAMVFLSVAAMLRMQPTFSAMRSSPIMLMGGPARVIQQYQPVMPAILLIAAASWISLPILVSYRPIRVPRTQEFSLRYLLAFVFGLAAFFATLGPMTPLFMVLGPLGPILLGLIGACAAWPWIESPEIRLSNRWMGRVGLGLSVLSLLVWFVMFRFF